MSEDKKDNGKKTLSLSQKLDPNKVGSSQVRQSFTHGRSKTVAVEVKKKRTIQKPLGGADSPVEEAAPEIKLPNKPKGLTDKEWESRLKAVMAEAERAKRAEAEDKIRAIEEEKQRKEAEARAEEERRLAGQKQAEEPATEEVEEGSEVEVPAVETVEQVPSSEETSSEAAKTIKKYGRDTDEDDEEAAKKSKHEVAKTKVAAKRDQGRREGKLTLERALIQTESDEDEIRRRSYASLKRAKEKERKKLEQQFESKAIVREVILPETITVQELSNRMAVRAADVIKSLMKMDVMANINQVIDADTAELVIEEFGHKVKRVSEADVEIGLGGHVDTDRDLHPRAPVVTIMGHVDHGKTSLLDAIRQTDVVAKEAGGITQHIGAYQVHAPGSDHLITFIDTPGHAAFTEMRARGAKVTDIVILVVAADDSVKEQTVEAINHVKAAGVPMIVAINKVDKPEANPQKVKTELLSHEVVVEDLGGETQCVEVSAKQKINLEGLLDSINILAEVLELKANPNASARGAVIEAKMEQGRGSIATILVQRGTLKVGDIFVSGSQTGRVRALIDDHGRNITSAGPSTPVEVLGFNDTPSAGDDFHVVDNEGRAREIAEYRARRDKLASAAKATKSLEDLFAQQADKLKKELAVVVKGDVQGSVEAIVNSLIKIDSDEVSIRVLHSGVGGITERDVILAKASNGIIIGFNVRANPQARELSKKDGIAIRYYSIIYNVIDDVKAALGGMLSPTLREKYLGQAEIRQVFNVTKVGKVAGCMITEGTVKRGAKVRLLRDDVVIHEGTLKTLRRFKDEVKEAKEGYECGMAFENYNDIKEGDKIECFEIEEIARTL